MTIFSSNDASAKIGVILLNYSRPDFTEQRLSQLGALNPEQFQIICSVDKFEGYDQNNIRRHFRLLSEKFPSVHWIFSEKRLGLANHVVERVTETLLEFERIIVIEDDISCSPESLLSVSKVVSTKSFGGSMTIGLFGCIPKFNPSVSPSFPWRRTKYFSAWGWSINRDMWSLYHLDAVKKLGIGAVEKTKAWKSLNESQKKRWTYRFLKVESNPTLTWDFQMQFVSWLYGLDHLLPVIRSCDNEGFHDVRATNTVDRKPRWYKGTRSDKLIEPIVIDPRKVMSRFLQEIDAFTWVGDKSFKHY